MTYTDGRLTLIGPYHFNAANGHVDVDTGLTLLARTVLLKAFAVCVVAPDPIEDGAVVRVHVGPVGDNYVAARYDLPNGVFNPNDVILMESDTVLDEFVAVAQGRSGIILQDVNLMVSTQNASEGEWDVYAIVAFTL